MGRKAKTGVLTRIMNMEHGERTLVQLEREGLHVVSSQFLGASYVQKGNSLILLAGKNGALSVDLDALPELIEEL